TFGPLEKKLGRKIDVTYSPTTTPAILGLIAGDYDFGIAYVQHAIKAQSEGKDIVVLAAMMDNPTAALVAREDEPEIKTPKDLKGKVMGVVSLGSGHHLIGLAAIEAYGLKADDVTFRSTGGISGWVPAMRSKRVDAIIVSEPTLSQLLDEHLGRILIDFHQREATHKVFNGPHPTVALLARREYVKAHPDVVKAVVDAQVEALHWIAQHKPAEVAQMLPDKLKNRPDAAKILTRVMPAISTTGRTTPEAINVTTGWLKKMGDVSQNATVDPAKVLDTQFVKD
ncbi:MAG: ABC transporter substrate-binding protein, partial [Acidobacteriota bacterium]